MTKTMAEQSSLEALAASLHRSVLGAMLAVVLLVTIGWGVNTLVVHQNPLGLLSLLVGLGAAYWIGSLFVEGLRER